jgi:phenylacetate-CoA ligase
MVMKAPPLKEEKYWNRAVETMPRRELLEFQWELLQKRAQYIYEKSRFYRERLDKAGVTPSGIRSIDDFREKIPLTVKEDIRSDIEKTGDIFGGTVCVPLEKLAYYGHSTGTSGQPTQTALTSEDIAFARESTARQYWAIGIRPGDLCAFFDPVTHPGAQMMELTPILMEFPYVRFALGSVFQELELDRWTQTFQNLPVRSCYLPFSMLWVYREYIEGKGISPRDIMGKTRCIFTSGDLITSNMRKLLEDYWGTKLHEFQISADIMFGFHTCEVRDGLHVPEDLFAIEVVNPKTGEQVPMGEKGYLVVTPTWQEGTCHLRWNTEDLVRMSDEPCECGRTSARIWFEGRLAYVVNVKGQEIFPHMVTDELLPIPEIGLRGFASQLIKASPETQDKLIVRTGYYEDQVSDPGKFKGEVQSRLEAKFGVPTEVELIPPQEVGLVLHKLQRIVKRY